MPNFGRSASEYNLGVLELIGQNQTVDISKLYLEINIYESLLENSMTCDITILDAVGLFNAVPIVGGSCDLHVIINSPLVSGVSRSADDIDMIFTVYKVSNRHNYKDRTQLYVLHCITPEVFTSSETKINRSYVSNKNRLCSDIAIDIFDRDIDSDTDFEVETTSNSINIIFPSHWSPFDGINHLASKSISKSEHNGAGYLFYENTRGYHFKSLESLSTTDTQHFLVYEPLNISANQLPHEGTVSVYNFDSMYDALNNRTRGMMFSKLIDVDFTLKSVSESIITYNDHDFDGKTSHLHDRRMFIEEFDDFQTLPHKLHVGISGSKVYDKNNAPKKPNTAEVMLKRIRRLQESNNIKLKTTMVGNSTIAVGDVVEFNLPNNVPQNSPGASADAIDGSLSGRFLVMTVRHKIDLDSYITILTLVKDSYKESPFVNERAIDASTSTARRNFF